MEAAVGAVSAAAKEQEELQIDLGDWSAENIRLRLWRLTDHLKKTPLCFRANTARQANAALFAYPGIAAVSAESDTYNVLKAAVRYGAEVMP
jgi:hypothetical protein